MSHVARFATEVFGLAQPTDIDFFADIDDVGSTGRAGSAAGCCRSCSSGWIIEEESVLVCDVSVLVALRKRRRGDRCKYSDRSMLISPFLRVRERATRKKGRT